MTSKEKNFASSKKTKKKKKKKFKTGGKIYLS